MSDQVACSPVDAQLAVTKADVERVLAAGRILLSVLTAEELAALHRLLVDKQVITCPAEAPQIEPDRIGNTGVS